MAWSYNRIASPRDFDGQLVIDRHPLVTEEILRGQHPQRSWEYSLALFAFDHWNNRQTEYIPERDEAAFLFADIGGSGSNFWQTLTRYTTKPVTRVDPNHEWALSDTDAAQHFRQRLNEYLQHSRAHKLAAFDAVFCLSVLEHVPANDLQPFERDLCSLVKPGGLLVLTCDAGESHPDVFHFNWMRERIYTPAGLDALQLVFRQQYGMRPLTPPDYRWDGPTVYDYGIGALALVKE